MGLRQNAGYSVDATGLARYVSCYGPMAEWLCSGLQNRVHRFNSGSGLHLLIDAMTPRRFEPRRYELCVLTRMSLREPPNQGVNYRLQCFSAY